MIILYEISDILVRRSDLQFTDEKHDFAITRLIMIQKRTTYRALRG